MRARARAGSRAFIARPTAGRRATTRTRAPAAVSASTAPAAAPPAPTTTAVAPAAFAPRSRSAASRPGPSVFSARIFSAARARPLLLRRASPSSKISVLAAPDARTAAERDVAIAAAAFLCGIVTLT